MASLRCTEHGWGIGELGCEQCDAKNNTDNPWARTTVEMGRASEAFQRMNQVMMYYYPIINHPTQHVKVVSAV